MISEFQIMSGRYKDLDYGRTVRTTAGWSQVEVVNELDVPERTTKRLNKHCDGDEDDEDKKKKKKGFSSTRRVGTKNRVPEGTVWRAVGMVEAGRSQKEVADILGVSASSVSKWMKEMETTGAPRKRHSLSIHPANRIAKKRPNDAGRTHCRTTVLRQTAKTIMRSQVASENVRNEVSIKVKRANRSTVQNSGWEDEYHGRSQSFASTTTTKIIGNVFGQFELL